jgi:hypothetical protein
MAIGEFTKQLAQQAILSATNKEPAPPPPHAQPDNIGAAILAQVGAMQKALKEDEELLVIYQNSGEKIRLVEIRLPTWRVAVLTGFDQERALARVVSPVDALQLVIRVVKSQPGAKPLRLVLIAPKQ